MHRTALRFGTPVATMVLGAVIGFAVGQRQGISWGARLLTGEVDFALSVHSEVASLIRVGDSERALWWLDQLIDNAILNVARHPVERAELRGLQIAKAYRTAIPTTGSEAAQITAALNRVPAAAPPFLCPLPSGIEVQASGLDRLTQTGRR